MPSQTTIKTKPLQLAVKSLGLALITSCLIGCGGGSGSGSAPSNVNNTGTTLKENEIEVLFPFGFNNVDLKLVDFLTGEVVAQSLNFSGNRNIMTFPVQRANQFYRLEIITKTGSQVFNPVTNSFNNTSNDAFEGSYKAFIFPTFEDRRSFMVSPISNIIYERTLVRAGQLAGESINPSQVKAYHFSEASTDVNNSLVNIFKNTAIPLQNLNTLNLASLGFNTSGQLYFDSYTSFGLFAYWYNRDSSKTFQKMTENLTIDLKDGYLDGRSLLGDNSSFVSLVQTVQNTDPSLNNAVDIANTQKTARDTFANLLRSATLNFAQVQNQSLIDPNGFKALQNYNYAGTVPLSSSEIVRTNGAGDYRLALGFTGSTATCFNSVLPCKQGLAGINNIIQRKSFPSVEYLIGTKTGLNDLNNTACSLKVRAEGQVELESGNIKVIQTLSAEGMDNLLQVNAAANQYLLNVGDAGAIAGKNNFIQLRITSNKVTSAVAGSSSEMAPSNLDLPTQLSCSFSS